MGGGGGDAATQRLQRTRTAGDVAQVTLGHDPRGNVLTRTQSGATLRFTYDLADRMLGTTRNNVLQATHVYDGNGLRTRTSAGARCPQPDRDLRFQIYTPSGVFQWENDIECSRLRSRGVNYVRLAGSLVAKVVADSRLTEAECYPGTSNSEQQTLSLNPFRNPFVGATEVVAGSDGGRDGEGEAPTAPTSTTTYSIVYVHTDALGSPVAETNTSATVISGSRTQYEPYGKPLTTPREGAPSYTGHQHDTSTGLIYAQQRYYDPQLGRFLSTDPMAVDMGSAGNWNRYAYAANSPYRFTDPDGRAPGAGARYIGDGMVGVDARMIGEMTNYGRRDPWSYSDAQLQAVVDNSPQVTYDWPSAPQPLVDFAAGWGDTMSMGLTEYIRERNGIDGGVDIMSGAYDNGGYFGVANSLAMGAGLFTGAARSGAAVTATRWGGEGVWYMVGGRSTSSWWLSGTRFTYTYESAATVEVAGTRLVYPSGWEWIKGLIGQRVLVP
ncbi:MAG: RHS repeat-associated core domain-containing protein [Xanthomonadales bacterium]|nr:RHS repeat-associated core domain-containing protein [Xanthomonadales bacterium]